MKSEEEIKERITYLEDYIAGQRNSTAAYMEEIIRAQYEINLLRWVLD